MKILELFGGIGACTKAFKRLGIPIEVVDYVEIDKYAVASYNAINGTSFEPQDITKWNKDIDVDFIMHGSPCQDFSVAGKGKGGDEGSGTRSSLMYETIRIVNKLKPKYVLWENVKNLLSKKHIHNFRNYISTMNELGYNSYYQVLNSKDYGIPQNRERVFTLSIRQDIDNGTFTFPKPMELELKLKDMLENEVDKKYYLSDKMTAYISANNDKWTGNNSESIINKDIASTINTGEGQRRCDASNYICNKLPDNYNIKIKNNTKPDCLGVVVKNKRLQETLEKNRNKLQDNSFINSYNRQVDNSGLSGTITTGVSFRNETHIINDLRIRKLTPKECWRLMGFNDSDFEKAEKVNSNAQLYKQAGNSIVVNVLERILENLFLKNENDFEGQVTFEMIGGNK